METVSVDMEQVWRAYHAGLQAFVLKRVGDPFLADDLVQDIFMKIHTKRETLRSDRKLQSWIYQIARNTIVDYYRTHRPNVALPAALDVVEEEADEQVSREIEECLMPMIQELPPAYREAVLLADIEGLTQKEVALRQDISLSGAKSRVQRGRALLKDLLMACCRFEFSARGQIIEYEKPEGGCTNC